MIRNRALIPCLLALSALLAFSCAGGDQSALERFLSASQAGDQRTVAALALVGFPEPVQSWQIVQAEPGTTEAYRLPELQKRLEEVTAARDAQFTELNSFRMENFDAVKKIQDRLEKEPDYTFPGELGGIQGRWNEYRQKRNELESSIADIKRQIDKELQMTRMSLMNMSDVANLTGDVSVRRFVVDVQTESGQKPYTIVLRRYELVDEAKGFRPKNRWIVTDIEGLPEGRATDL